MHPGLGPTRAATLVPPTSFHPALRRCAKNLDPLESERLGAAGLDATAVAGALWGVIERMEITETGTRLVACTKALRHLMPELVVPMDRQFTGAFFGWNTYAWQKHEERSFKIAFPVSAEIARRANPMKYVGGSWNTSPNKVIDNASIGYCRVHALDAASRTKLIVARAKALGMYGESVASTSSRGNDTRGE